MSSQEARSARLDVAGRWPATSLPGVPPAGVQNGDLLSGELPRLLIFPFTLDDFRLGSLAAQVRGLLARRNKSPVAALDQLAGVRLLAGCIVSPSQCVIQVLLARAPRYEEHHAAILHLVRGKRTTPSSRKRPRARSPAGSFPGRPMSDLPATRRAALHLLG